MPFWELTAFLRTGWHTMPEIAAAVGHHPAWVWVLVKRIAVTSPVFRQRRRAFRKPWEYRMFEEVFNLQRGSRGGFAVQRDTQPSTCAGAAPLGDPPPPPPNDRVKKGMC